MYRMSYPTRRWLAALLCVSLVLLGSGPGCARQAGTVTVPLRFRPTARLDLNAFGGAAPQTPVYVGDVRDGRPVKDAIGAVFIGDDQSPVYSGGREPTEFVRLVMKDLLGRSRLTVADERTAAGLVVLAELNEFWARQTDTCGAAIGVTVTIQDRAGAQVWKGVVTGTSRRFRPGLDAGGYQEIFSDAALDLVERLLRDRGFRESLHAGTVAGR